MTWTTDIVWERVHEAFQTFTRLPGDMPAGYGGSMPEHLPEAREVFAIAVDEGGYRSSVVRMNPGAPTGDMIDRAMETLAWCWDAGLKPKHASWICLWGSVAGQGAGPKICRRLNISRSSLQRYRHKALRTITSHLNGNTTSCAKK